MILYAYYAGCFTGKCFHEDLLGFETFQGVFYAGMCAVVRSFDLS